MGRLSIIVPALNEAAGIAECLAALAPMRARGAELVVVDGGSTDATAANAAPLADRVMVAPRGRASQMNAGARAATGEVLLFLHADMRLPPDADRLVAEGLAGTGRLWGRFDIRIEGSSTLLAIVSASMNVRSRLTGIATGDQAIFARREAFERAGGFPAIALMEDVAFSKTMKRQGKPLCLTAKAATSGRRWQRNGTMRTILLMWWLRLAYFLGVDPALLARRYGAQRTEH